MTLLTILEKINKNKLLTRTYFDTQTDLKKNYNFYMLKQDPLIADIVDEQIKFVFNKTPYFYYSLGIDELLDKIKITQTNIERVRKEIIAKMVGPNISNKEHNELDEYRWMYVKGFNDCNSTIKELEKVIKQLNEFYGINNI